MLQLRCEHALEWLQTDYVDFDVSDDEEPEQPASKRVRLDTGAQTSDATLDAETAWALGFTPATLTTEEEDLLPADSDEGVYCRVGVYTCQRIRALLTHHRNHVIMCQDSALTGLWTVAWPNVYAGSQPCADNMAVGRV